MSLPLMAQAILTKRAAKKACKLAKRARIEAKRTVLTSAGHSLKIPPRWTLNTIKSKLKQKLHAAIRERDGSVCFSCGCPGLVLALRGSWQAGHLFAVAIGKAIEFHPLNIHSQCSSCNSGYCRGGRGNVAAYSVAFIRRYGHETYLALDEARRAQKMLSAADLLDLLNTLNLYGLASYSEQYSRLTEWPAQAGPKAEENP